jgi:hypothetical protein
MRLLNRFVEGGLAGFIGRLLQQCSSRVMESPGAFSSTRISDPEEYEPVLRPNSTSPGLKNVLLVGAVPSSAAYASSHPLRDVYLWYARWLCCAIL